MTALAPATAAKPTRPAPWTIFDYIKLLSIGFLLLPVAQRMSQDDYLIVRCLATFVGVYGAYRAFTRKRLFWTAGFIVMAALFNPVLRFHLGREGWVIVDLATVALLTASLSQAL